MKVFRNECCLFEEDRNVLSFKLFHVCNHGLSLTLSLESSKLLITRLIFSFPDDTDAVNHRARVTEFC